MPAKSLSYLQLFVLQCNNYKMYDRVTIGIAGGNFRAGVHALVHVHLNHVVIVSQSRDHHTQQRVKCADLVDHTEACRWHPEERVCLESLIREQWCA